MIIVLGPPGCGAEEVGAELIASGHRVLHSDLLAEEHAGMSLPDLAITQGQKAVEKATEAGALAGFAARPDILILGSGALGNEPGDEAGKAVRAALAQARERGDRTVCLMAQPHVLSRRSGLDAPRRVALGAPRAMFLAMLTKRMPLYEEGNDIIATDDGDWPTIAACLVDHSKPGNMGDRA
ncbi:MAG: hypothetical protein Q4P33_02320 [Flaviflexus sp.]|nr:hypothetical protein [Flaviflexus sp.]